MSATPIAMQGSVNRGNAGMMEGRKENILM
jgi:hypothetical protein